MHTSKTSVNVARLFLFLVLLVSQAPQAWARSAEQGEEGLRHFPAILPVPFSEDAEAGPWSLPDEARQEQSLIAVTCSGTQCDFTDPQGTGCSANALIADSVTMANGKVKVELRYSNSCGTNWVRVSNSTGGTVTAYLYTTRNVNIKSTSASSSWWTVQLYCPTGGCQARACGTYNGATACTGWK